MISIVYFNFGVFWDVIDWFFLFNIIIISGINDGVMFGVFRVIVDIRLILVIVIDLGFSRGDNFIYIRFFISSFKVYRIIF